MSRLASIGRTLGELESASGLRNLVLVTFDPGIISFFLSQPVTASPWPDPMTYIEMAHAVPVFHPLRQSASHPPHIRIFAGQRDPNDPSRFTVRYQVWAQEDIIDGRMDDKGMITLTPRKMPAQPAE